MRMKYQTMVMMNSEHQQQQQQSGVTVQHLLTYLMYRSALHKCTYLLTYSMRRNYLIIVKATQGTRIGQKLGPGGFPTRVGWGPRVGDQSSLKLTALKKQSQICNKLPQSWSHLTRHPEGVGISKQG